MKTKQHWSVLTPLSMAWQREFLAVVFCHICKFHLCSELPACCWLAPMLSAPCYSQPWPNSFTGTDESLKILLILNYTLKQYISPKYFKQSGVSTHNYKVWGRLRLLPGLDTSVYYRRMPNWDSCLIQFIFFTCVSSGLFTHLQRWAITVFTVT